MKRLSPQPVIVTVLSSVAVALALSAAIGWWAVLVSVGLVALFSLRLVSTLRAFATCRAASLPHHELTNALIEAIRNG